MKTILLRNAWAPQPVARYTFGECFHQVLNREVIPREVLRHGSVLLLVQLHTLPLANGTRAIRWVLA